MLTRLTTKFVSANPAISNTKQNIWVLFLRMSHTTAQKQKGSAGASGAFQSYVKQGSG